MAALGGVLGALLLLALIALVILGHKQFGRRLKCCSGKALVRPERAGAAPRAHGGGQEGGPGGRPSPRSVEADTARKGKTSPRPCPPGRLRGQSQPQPGRGLGDALIVPSPRQDHQALAFDNQAFSDPQEANWAPAPRASPGPTRAGPPEPPEPTPQEASGSAAAGPAPGAPEAARDGGSPAAVRSILTKERRPDEGGYKAVWFGEDIGAEADVVVLNAPAPDAARAPDSGSEHSGDGDDEDGEPGGGSTYV